MNKIYCISGLGADQRIFKKLSIDNYELTPLHWVSFNKNDSVASYAKKMAASITEKNPIILGLSFGGMLAVEIGKIIAAQKIFLVSSAKTADELSDPGGIVRWVISSNILPAIFFSTPNRFILDHFGAETPDEKQLLTSIIRDSDGSFMKWALKALLTWNNENYPANVTHIHGTADKIIPAANVNAHHWIKDGSHIMIYNRAQEVSKIISECLL